MAMPDTPTSSMRPWRSQAAARTAEQFTHILDVQGIPGFPSPVDQALLLGLQTFGDWLPSVTVLLVKSHPRHETADTPRT